MLGISFKEGAGDECAAAVAILLLGCTGTALPGGYAGEEISFASPIVQVSEFPSEFILLGRATVMIKGIANRLGLQWGLADRWARVAQEAVAATLPSERLPIWSVVSPAVSTTALPCKTIFTAPAGSKIALSDILGAFLVLTALVQV